MNDTRIDSIATARGFVRQARDKARDSARRHPDSTWIDAYTAIDRADVSLGLADPSPSDPSAPDAAHGHPPLCCGELLRSADATLADVIVGDGPSGLLLARAYLTEAIAEVAGRLP